MDKPSKPGRARRAPGEPEARPIAREPVAAPLPVEPARPKRAPRRAKAGHAKVKAPGLEPELPPAPEPQLAGEDAGNLSQDFADLLPQRLPAERLGQKLHS